MTLTGSSINCNLDYPVDQPDSINYPTIKTPDGAEDERMICTDSRYRAIAFARENSGTCFDVPPPAFRRSCDRGLDIHVTS